MKLDSLESLFVDQLKDLYNAEQQIMKALPKMAKAASNSELKSGFEQHLEQTKKQAERLEQIFEELEIQPKGKKCVAMEGLIEEGQSIIKDATQPNVLDAGLIAAAQKVEHYEIAGYGTARTYASLLGLSEAANLLQETLTEEEQTDRKLTDLAETSINAQAAEAGEEEEEDPDEFDEEDEEDEAA